MNPVERALTASLNSSRRLPTPPRTVTTRLLGWQVPERVRAADLRAMGFDSRVVAEATRTLSLED